MPMHLCLLYRFYCCVLFSSWTFVLVRSIALLFLCFALARLLHACSLVQHSLFAYNTETHNTATVVPHSPLPSRPVSLTAAA